jgi:hypothetical protein
MINSPFLGTGKFPKNQSLYYSHNTSVPEPSSSYLVDRPYPVNTRTPLYFTYYYLILNLVKLVDLVEAEIKDECLALITPD